MTRPVARSHIDINLTRGARSVIEYRRGARQRGPNKTAWGAERYDARRTK